MNVALHVGVLLFYFISFSHYHCLFSWVLRIAIYSNDRLCAHTIFRLCRIWCDIFAHCEKHSLTWSKLNGFSEVFPVFVSKQETSHTCANDLCGIIYYHSVKIYISI